jgi:hypothetical protein
MTTNQTAYCGHAECVQAVNEWIEAGRPDLTPEGGTAGVMTHMSEVLFYARRDWLASCYEAAVAEGRGYTDEQRGAHVMRDREQRRRQWRAVRPRNRRTAA